MKNSNYLAFINKWWSNFGSPLPLEVENWIDNSYLNDESFWNEVFSTQTHVLPPSNSHFASSYDFYHDCILRHLKNNSIAFSIVQGEKYPDQWTFERIHHCVNYHVNEWSYDQPQPGDLIAIVGEPNLHFVLSLLTSLRFGLKICYFPTKSPFLGKGQITQYLMELKPKFLVTQDPSFAKEGAIPFTINEKGTDEENHTPHSFAYPADDPFQIALSVQQQEELTLVTLKAHKSYLCALRDALFTLNLPQHSYWAAPFACPLRTEPCSTLISFLCGITKVYVADEVIKKNPHAIEDERIQLLGIAENLQKLWQQDGGLPARYLKCCYKSPLDTSFPSWKAFVQLHKIEKVPQFDLVMDTTLEGALFFSRPSLDSLNTLLKPTVGTSWYLSDYNGSGRDSLTGYGIFELSEHKSLGNYTATQIENDIMLTGVVEPTRLGVTFPIKQLESYISQLSFVEECVLHPLSKSPFNHFFILLVFVSPLLEKMESSQWTKEINQQISIEMGPGYLPDKIEYFALTPKKNLSGVDRNWCVNQYNSGLLMQKSELTEFKLIGALKKLIQQ